MRSDKELFIFMLSLPPFYGKFAQPLEQDDRTMQQEYRNRLYGASVFNLTGNPLISRIEEQMAKAEVIQKSGKYYRFSNVLYQKYEQIDMFVDIWILVTTAETFEDIDELNKL